MSIRANDNWEGLDKALEKGGKMVQATVMMTTIERGRGEEESSRGMYMTAREDRAEPYSYLIYMPLLSLSLSLPTIKLPLDIIL